MAHQDDISFIGRALKRFCRGTLLRPRNVGNGTGTILHCHEVSRTYAVCNPGTRVVHGWTVNGVYQSGVADLAAFQYHSVVELNPGELVDPNWRPGQEELFVEDVARPYDYATRTAWNNLVIADRPFRCPVTHNRLLLAPDGLPRVWIRKIHSTPPSSPTSNSSLSNSTGTSHHT